jgi:hypothetical protein
MGINLIGRSNFSPQLLFTFPGQTPAKEPRKRIVRPKMIITFEGESKIMKKLLAMLFALALTAGVAIAQDTSSTAAPSDNTAKATKSEKKAKKHAKKAKKSKKEAASTPQSL